MRDSLYITHMNVPENRFKNTYPHNKAIEIILESRGSHLDPEIVDACLTREKMFDKNRDYPRDEPLSPQPKSERIRYLKN